MPLAAGTSKRRVGAGSAFGEEQAVKTLDRALNRHGHHDYGGGKGGGGMGGSGTRCCASCAAGMVCAAAPPGCSVGRHLRHGVEASCKQARGTRSFTELFPIGDRPPRPTQPPPSRRQRRQKVALEMLRSRFLGAAGATKARAAQSYTAARCGPRPSTSTRNEAGGGR